MPSLPQWESQNSEIREEGQRKEYFPQVMEGLVRDQLGSLYMHKSIKPDGMHPQVRRELTDVVTLLLSITSEKSWRMEEVPNDLRKSSVTPIFK